MAIARHFYHGLLRKYVAVFGTLVNNIKISRVDNDGDEIQKFIVPIAYGPWQKWLAMRTEDPNHEKKRGLQLPRMSFEITGMAYDPERKIGQTERFHCSTDGKTSVGAGAPYNMEINLYIMAKYAEDAAKIAEQIIPFFNPGWKSSVKLIRDMAPFDVLTILNSTSIEDTYEGDFATRRAIIWTLSFTMKGYIFGPATGPNHGNDDGSEWDDGVNNGKLIKMIDVSMYGNPDMVNSHQKRIQVFPGLTADGDPTTNPADSIPFQDIEETDDWAVIEVMSLERD